MRSGFDGRHPALVEVEILAGHRPGSIGDGHCEHGEYAPLVVLEDLQLLVRVAPADDPILGRMLFAECGAE
jgi:hypothetical protein